ncbi:lipase family protein [Azotosporobacter soli]|uniref:lipase family protein n=1 Tax=Azotosporobacter soli TaxID=3055040 RepID=UPI0031FE6D96
MSVTAPASKTSPFSGGYVHEEAANFIEFCIELNNQDNRFQLKDSNDAAQLQKFEAAIDPALWNPVPLFDSRKQVAADYIRFRTSPSAPEQGEDDLSHWEKLFTELEARAAAKNLTPLTQELIESSPDLNGFGPWQNAWLLYQGVGSNAGRYAIAIRGTVFSNSPSAIEDAFFQPVQARRFLSDAVSFAASDAAALHSGFAHATFTTLFDLRYGILQILNEQQLPTDAVLYIVGHSQGASMATLIHSFFHHAMQSAETTGEDPFALKDTRYHLKSYAFAQPKPGTPSFASDFARITQQYDNAVVINNDLDSIPKVPLTLESMSDLETAFPPASIATRLLRFISGFSSGFRSLVGAVIEPHVRKSAQNYGYFYRYDSLKPLRSIATDSSWCFEPAGQVLFVFGTPTPPQFADDLFYQHHATTYRELIRAQLGE